LGENGVSHPFQEKLDDNSQNHNHFQPNGVSRRLQVQSGQGRDRQRVDRLFRRGWAMIEPAQQTGFPIVIRVASTPGGAVPPVALALALRS